MSEYSPEDQALIDRVNADHEALSGHARLWGWFGLSRASFLTIPRVLMHEMPDEWQKRMAVLLEEYDDYWDHGAMFDAKPYVSARSGNRFVRFPDWLLNYRHPINFDKFRSKRV